MKLFVSIFLVLAHLFSTVGFNMSIHECGGKKSYSIYGLSLHQHCKCEHDNEEHGNNCCSDKEVQVKGENKDKNTVKVFVAKTIDHFDNPITFFQFCQKGFDGYESKSLTLKAKHPPDHSPPLYKLYGVFLI